MKKSYLLPNIINSIENSNNRINKRIFFVGMLSCLMVFMQLPKLAVYKKNINVIPDSIIFILLFNTPNKIIIIGMEKQKRKTMFIITYIYHYRVVRTSLRLPDDVILFCKLSKSFQTRTCVLI